MIIDLGPKRPLGYAANPLDRASERRVHEDFLRQTSADPRAEVFAICGESIILHKSGEGLAAALPFAQAHALGPHAETVFLGLNGGIGRFGVAIERAALSRLKEREDIVTRDLRSLASDDTLTPEILSQLAQAKALLHWHARHRFCSNCGQPTQMVQGGWRRDCPACEGQHFPRTDPVVIMLAIRGDTCLMGRQSRFLPKMWSCLAGFVEPGESIEAAVRRETREEAGITCGRVSYFASQPWPFPMTLMIGCHAEALTSDITIDQTELEGARWITREEVTMMLTRKHPDGLITPHHFAIAHHIIRAWVENPHGLF